MRNCLIAIAVFLFLCGCHRKGDGMEAFMGNSQAKQARSYYYKAVSLLSESKTEEALHCLKQCEQMALELDEKPLQHLVNTSLANLNIKAGDYGLAKSYIKKDIALSRLEGKADWEAMAEQQMSLVYHRMGQEDSVRECIRRSVQMVDKVESKSIRAAMLDNIGYFTLSENPSKALGYLERSVSLHPSASACSHIAIAMALQGREAEADSLWRRAWEMGSVQERHDMLGPQLKYKKSLGRHAEADSLSALLLAFNDSVSSLHDAVAISVAQRDFDHRVERRRYQSLVSILYASVVIAALVLVVAGATLFHRRRKERRRQRELQEDLLKKTVDMETLASSNADYRSSMAKQKQLIDEQKVVIAEQRMLIDNIQDRNNDDFLRGKSLWDGIREGGTVVMWTAADHKLFFSYYASVNTAFMLQLKTDYESLTNRSLLYLIFQREGMDVEGIAHALGVNVASVRNIKSRTNKKSRGK